VVSLLPALAFLAPFQGAESEPRCLLRFRAEAVDGVDELVVRGRAATIRHLEWQEMSGVELVVAAEPPVDPALRVVVRAKSGRPAVRVVQGPSRENGGELRVRIDDGPHAGAAPLAFELWAVPLEAGGSGLDVVVITIDSLRPDRLGCYGYARATSPNLDLFAREAVRFTNAFSPSSFTPPAHASLLTSRHVGDHGLLTWNPLPEEQLTLPEVLASRGWRTGASVNLTLLTANALGQGVEWQREGLREARTIVSDALEFLRAEDGRPFFLWLHLYDVHRPYGRIPGWAERFARHARPEVGDGEEHYNLTADDRRAQALKEDDLRWIEDRYDAGIAYADAQLGPLLAELATPARRARTLVVITADHGESLQEHEERYFTHDPFLFAAVARVPLLVRYPDGLGAGAVRDDLVSLIDVAPTVLETLALEAPPTFEGRSLRALERGRRFGGRLLFQECWGWERLCAARDERWFALRDLAAGTLRLYDLRSDPDERAPLDPERARGARELLRALDGFAARRPADEAPPELDPELLERLRELGYAGDER
jgi:arylsulfatase A-like enzyme